VLAAFQPEPSVRRRLAPNIVVILTDDQSPETIPASPPVMPKLQAMVQDPRDDWITFENAFVTIPLCCPSRASILAGEYPHHTGVLTNGDGGLFDPSSTVAVWLKEAGYTTALIGKYLNGWPFGRSAIPPPGWDHWIGKIQGDSTSVYRNFALSERGFPVAYQGRDAYTTDVLADAATDFIASAPSDAPFFLYFAPTAPHSPRIPAPAYRGSWTGEVARPGSFNEADVSDKPAWVQRLPDANAERRAHWDESRRAEYETLRSVDDAVAQLIAALRDRAVLDDTIVVFLTDNGYAFGEHRWDAKSCPYDPCVRTPLLIRYPGATSRTETGLVSTVDLAPTFAAIARTRTGPVDGTSLVPVLEGRSSRTSEGVLIRFAGFPRIPAWWQVRTDRYAYIEYETGETELYDVVEDPDQMQNRAGTPGTSEIVPDLAALLRRLRTHVARPR
jgi:arylsulfatase A-like enzyme